MVCGEGVQRSGNPSLLLTDQPDVGARTIRQLWDTRHRGLTSGPDWCLLGEPSSFDPGR
jgi:hypothetical protein